VVSPGVKNKASPIIWAEKDNIPIISEIELAWLNCLGKIIAVTGTNGKSTVTALIGEILKSSGRKTFVLGNIGVPFCSRVQEVSSSDFVSLEISSFQLERISRFKPKVALILNFNQNHLDRHRDMHEYLEAKKKIFMNQDKDDYTVLNYADPIVKNLAGQTKAKVLYFNTPNLKHLKFNLNPNQLAALTVASLFGITEELCLEVFKQFKGLEHRLEFVTQIDGVEFINDSKSTNVDSTIWALENITRPIILIAGGRDKGIDFSPLSSLAKEKVKEMIVIGEARGKIKDAFGQFLPLLEAPSLEEAVKLSLRDAKKGDCVLLSPMCASFDMFDDFEHRGRIFKEIVNQLASNLVKQNK
jgi:UDP-N-acetylmuramoylalanine--D-glutamate ligase